MAACYDSYVNDVISLRVHYKLSDWKSLGLGSIHKQNWEGRTGLPPRGYASLDQTKDIVMS